MPRIQPSDGGRRHPGFSLPELLVVLVIIGVLAAVIIPLSKRIRESAQRAACIANLRQCGVGILGYASERNGLLPKGYDSVAVNWATTVSQYLGDEREIEFRGAGNKTHKMKVAETMVSPLHKKPSYLRGGALPSSYAFNSSVLGLLNTYSDTTKYVTPPLRVSIITEPARTFILALGVDAALNSTAIEYFRELSNTSTRLGVNGKSNMLFADGHVEVRTIAKSTGDEGPDSTNNVVSRNRSPNENVLYR